MRLSRGRGGNPEANEPAEFADVESADLPPGDLLVEEVPTSDTVTVLAAVNLLPKTYARRAAVKKAKIFAAAAVVVALLLALLGWMIAWQKETAAQEALDAATAERTLLTAEVAQYSEVPKVFSAVADAQAQLRLAMGNEVRWSFFLNDLALTMPSGVSLDTLAVTSPAPGAPTQATAPSSAGASSASEPTSGAGVPGLGTMNVSAKAFTYNSVANWLDSLAKLPTVADPYVGSISAGTEEGTKIVTFTSTGNVTAEALSNRYLNQEVAP
jgi:Tfp pilus assembly protein PilN